MAVLGRVCLILALAVCVYGIGASVYGARTGAVEFSRSGRRSVYTLAGILTFAFALLEIAFLRSDFAFNTVADTSSRSTPTFYKAAAVWSSQEGSLLLWAWLLSLWSSLALLLTRGRIREVASYATAILLGFGGFFVSLMIFYANPFSTTTPAPVEGDGLDPLLRFPTMMIHPPMLYSGYTLCTIPFAFAAGALIARRREGGAGDRRSPSRAPLSQSLDSEWIAVVRRFALASWLFLGIGILLGASWSYSELGWGGYWGWDAVENASLLPWLTGTAFLHSLMIQERRGMLKVWNVSLALATGTLAIMGTFLVRSGILDSIHAFGGATLGVPFLILIAVMLCGSLYLVVSRRDGLSSQHRLDSLLSREAIFLFNNIVLVALAFVIFWGTWFPKISEALTGQAASVGPPWFDRYTVPLALILVLLSGIGPVIAWRRATFAGVRRNLAAPIAAGVLTLVVLLATGVAQKATALAMFACAAFVLASVAQELWRGTRVRRAASREAPPVALVALIRRNRRRYGGYIVHVGMAVLFIGVAASSSFQHVATVTLSPGQSTHVGSYAVRYMRPTATVSARQDTVHTGSTLNIGAVLRVTKDGRYVATLRPSEGFYESQEEAQGSVGRLIGGQTNVSHVSMNTSLTRNVWSAISPELSVGPQGELQGGTPRLQRIVAVGNKTIPMSRPDEGMIAVWLLAREYLRHPLPAQFKLLVSPLIMWIWIGGLIVFGGGLLALSPTPGSLRRRALVLARARRAAAARAERPEAISAPAGPGLQPAAADAAAISYAEDRAAADLAALETAREVKYRELRELELDYGTGKLSRSDYEETGAALRAEALAVLDRIESLTGADGAPVSEIDPVGDAGVTAGV
ncbi:MAG TPA: cytochrome c-type biogenesis CcmF C-terminal domain-containing protein [Solirubrobacteraceae bacterium]|jgi:cytochrome c-type biogenesis protein CcmF|nr:cytochrome c-type biogenesis CcmF C-terminal domain-containing protein [Solirubrobacteraceae bacterium]